MLKIKNTDCEGEYEVLFNGSVIGYASKVSNWIGSGSHVDISLKKRDDVGSRRQIGTVDYKKNVCNFIYRYMEDKGHRISKLKEYIEDLDESIDILGQHRLSTSVLTGEIADAKDKLYIEKVTFYQEVYDYANDKEG